MTGPQLHTDLCDLLGIEYPIIQAPMGGGLAPAELVAAVSAAGGLGVIGTIGTPQSWWLDQIRRVRSVTTSPFAVNVLMFQDASSGVQGRLVDALLDERVPVVHFSWRGAEQFFGAFRRAGIKVLHQVATIDDARRSVDAGADVIIAQGAEAGGHVLSRVGGLALVPQIVDAVAPVPVVAAGGISDGRGIAAVLALGAQGVALGTRFLASVESGAHERYKQAVVEAATTQVVKSTLFDSDWPDAPANILDTDFVRHWEAETHRDPFAKHLAEKPIAAVQFPDMRYEIRRFSTATATRSTEGNIQQLAFYMGQGTGMIDSVDTASEIVHQLVSETVAVWARRAREHDLPPMRERARSRSI